VRVLGKWPSGFHEQLRALLPASVSDHGSITFRSVYGDFYQYLLDAAHHREFKFLVDAFDEFVVQCWPGVVRGQHRLVPQSTREKMSWIPALQAARLAGLTASQITELVREGKLTGTFVRPSKSSGRIECWLDRESLKQWIGRRDADFSDFISQAEAMQFLGLTTTTLSSLACNGVVELCKGRTGDSLPESMFAGAILSASQQPFRIARGRK
jgi:hypothetical protein